MVRVSSSAKLRPWSELTAKMMMGVVPGLVRYMHDRYFLKLVKCKYYMLATCRKLFEILCHDYHMRIIPQHVSGHLPM